MPPLSVAELSPAANGDASLTCRTSRDRMRRTRERHRAGLRSVPLDVRDSEIKALIKLGLMARDATGDVDAIGVALGRWLDTIQDLAQRYPKLFEEAAQRRR